MSSNERLSFVNEELGIEYGKSLGRKFHTLENSDPTYFSPSTNGSLRTILSSSPSECSASLKRKIDDSNILDEKKRKDASGSSLCVSPWEFRRLRADLIESHAQIVKLEDRIDELHKKNKEQVIFFDKEKNEMKLQLELSRNTAKDLEYRLHKIRKREAECKEELTERIKLLESEKQKLNDKIIIIESKNTEFKIKLDELKSNSETTLSKLQNEIKHLNEENKRVKLNLEEKEELCNKLEERLLLSQRTLADADETKKELQIVQLKLKELENERAEYEEARQLTVVLGEKLLRLPDIEKELLAKQQEVSNLQQSIHNKVLLEELIHDLKLKLAAMEERERQIPILKAELAELEIELKKWVSVAKDYGKESTLDSLRNYIENLHEKEVATSLEMNNLNAALRTSENKISTLQYELENIKQMNEKLDSSLQKLRVEVQVLRKKSILITRERDSYRQQLDLYEKDLTMTGLSNENLSNEICNQMKERVKTLEDSLEEYRKHVDVLEAQLKEYQSEDQTDNAMVIKKLKDEVRELEESNKFLSKIRDELETKLEERALKGDYLSPNVKILHFKENPVAEAQRKQKEDINNLKEEYDKLRARVRLLESGEVLDITQKVTENIQNFSSERVKELEKELDSANLKMQRLKEVYRKTSQEFCDVSYMLLGYRIVLVSNNKLYKLYNMYSTSPSDYLMFQQTKTGGMEMLGTPFAESLSKLVDEHLHKGNSIPAFLAAVTLSLYSSTEQSEEEEEDEFVDHEEPPEEIELD